ncbi:MAG: pilus assembly protein PilM, partial [Magnetococcus sp. WYHC-3]
MGLFGTGFSPLLGIDIGASAIKLVEVRPAGRGWRLLRSALGPLPEGAVGEGQIKRPDSVADVLKTMLPQGRLATRRAALSLQGSSVITKRITVPRMSELDMEDQIGLEAEEHIPFDLDDMRLDFQILNPQPTSPGVAPENPGTMDVLLAACKRDVVDAQADVARRAGLNPVLVDPGVLAAGNAWKTLCLPPRSPTPPPAMEALLSIGHGLSNLLILQQGLPDYSRDLPFGGRLLSDDGTPAAPASDSAMVAAFLERLGDEMEQALTLF